MAMENHLEEGQDLQVSSDLQQMLLRMVARKPSDRPALPDITAAAALQVHGSGTVEVDSLATYILGNTHDVSRTLEIWSLVPPCPAPTLSSPSGLLW